MKALIIIAVLCLWAAPLSAQWLDTIVPVDSSPFILCHNTQNDFVYCANWAANNVSVIDGATNAVIATVPVGTWPQALIYSPTNNKVFCLNNMGKSITVIDGATNTVDTTLALGTSLWDGLLCPFNEKLYILEHTYNRVLVMDCHTYALDTAITFPSSPYGVCYDQTDNRVYVATRADSAVRAIDCATNSIIATIKVGPEPNKLCWNSQDNKVYTATADNNDSTVAVIDCATNTVVAMLKPGKWPYSLCYEPNYSQVYVSFWDEQRVAVIDGVNNQVVANISTAPGYPSNLCAVPQHYYVFVTLQNDSVIVVEVNSNTIIARVGVGDGPDNPIYNPIDDRVYTADGNGKTVSILFGSAVGIAEQLPTTAVRHITPTIARNVLFLPSAEGGKRSAGDASLLDISGRKVVDLHTGANDVRHLAPGVYFIIGNSSPIKKEVIIVR
ncbi:MAG: YncE family protein [candidate division WOR-3 bacterium]